MKFSLSLSLLAVALVAAGCSQVPSKVIDANYAVYTKSVNDQNTAVLNAANHPIWQIKGVPGQTITLSGVSEISVYAPASGNANNLAPIQPYVAPKNEFVESVKAIGEVAAPWTGVASIYVGGKALTNLTTSVGNSANAGYQYVQAPAPNMTIGGNGVIGAGTFSSSDLSGTGVIGAGSYSALAGTGVLGAGSYSSLAGTGTLGSGAYSTNALSGTGTTGTGTYNPSVTNTGGPGGAGGPGGTGTTGTVTN